MTVMYNPILFQDDPCHLLLMWGSETITEDMRDFGYILTGDELHTRGKSRLSNIIMNEMTYYFKSRNLPVPKEGIFSHVGFCRWDKGVLWISGAVENGFKPRKYRDYYADTTHIIIRETWYTEEQKRLMVTKCIELESKNWSYQYWGLLQAYIYVRLRWNWFRKNNEKFLYCYEALRRIKDVVFHYSDNLEITMYDKLRNKNQLVVFQKTIQ